mmetsp:Transcript_21840/g.44885  ORF Transcript_21840/g.44885 Transcript_21840/m.44885 type:complete len:211 (+) Transcript_21840:1819-2451(+)
MKALPMKWDKFLIVSCQSNSIETCWCPKLTTTWCLWRRSSSPKIGERICWNTIASKNFTIPSNWQRWKSLSVELPWNSIFFRMTMKQASNDTNRSKRSSLLFFQRLMRKRVPKLSLLPEECSFSRTITILATILTMTMTQNLALTSGQHKSLWDERQWSNSTSPRKEQRWTQNPLSASLIRSPKRISTSSKCTPLWVKAPSLFRTQTPAV